MAQLWLRAGMELQVSVEIADDFVYCKEFGAAHLADQHSSVSMYAQFQWLAQSRSVSTCSPQNPELQSLNPNHTMNPNTGINYTPQV